MRMPKKFLFKILALASAALWSHPASSGYLVVQKATVTRGSEKTVSTHTWSVDTGRFRLLIDSQGTKASYIFNGRNFYVCGVLNPKQIEFLGSQGIDSKSIAKKYQKGTCQTVPINFMVRFFVAPIDAVDSVDQSDGLKVTLKLASYSLNKGSMRNVKNEPCRDFTRKYQIAKEFSHQSKNLSFSSENENQNCQSTKVDWRKKLWKEVSKALIRQPKGARVLSQLRSDFNSHKGLTLRSVSQTKITDSKGNVSQITRSLETISFSERKLSKKTFRPPFGFQMFSPEALALESLKDMAKDKPTEKKKEESLLDSMSSVFFCAIAGSFGCFNF